MNNVLFNEEDVVLAEGEERKQKERERVGNLFNKRLWTNERTMEIKEERRWWIIKSSGNTLPPESGQWAPALTNGKVWSYIYLFFSNCCFNIFFIFNLHLLLEQVVVQNFVVKYLMVKKCKCFQRQPLRRDACSDLTWNQDSKSALSKIFPTPILISTLPTTFAASTRGSIFKLIITFNYTS